MEDYSSAGASSAQIAALMGVILIPTLIITLIVAISFWKIFAKAGKPGWAAIIPIYNIIVFLEIIGKPVWWIILFLLPCVQYVFFIWSLNLLSKSFRQSEGFTVGLLLLPFVFFPILAFGNYQYAGPAGAGFAGNFNQPFDPNNYNPPSPPPQV